jgi:hypothetical protein
MECPNQGLEETHLQYCKRSLAPEDDSIIQNNGFKARHRPLILISMANKNARKGKKSLNKTPAKFSPLQGPGRRRQLSGPFPHARSCVFSAQSAWPQYCTKAPYHQSTQYTDLSGTRLTLPLPSLVALIPRLVLSTWPFPA